MSKVKLSKRSQRAGKVCVTAKQRREKTPYEGADGNRARTMISQEKSKFRAGSLGRSARQNRFDQSPRGSSIFSPCRDRATIPEARYRESIGSPRLHAANCVYCRGVLCGPFPLDHRAFSAYTRSRDPRHAVCCLPAKRYAMRSISVSTTFLLPLLRP